jgi:hypothetical protein
MIEPIIEGDRTLANHSAPAADAARWGCAP